MLCPSFFIKGSVILVMGCILNALTSSSQVKSEWYCWGALKPSPEGSLICGKIYEIPEKHLFYAFFSLCVIYFLLLFAMEFSNLLYLHSTADVNLFLNQQLLLNCGHPVQPVLPTRTLDNLKKLQLCSLPTNASNCFFLKNNAGILSQDTRVS